MHLISIPVDPPGAVHSWGDQPARDPWNELVLIDGFVRSLVGNAVGHCS